MEKERKKEKKLTAGKSISDLLYQKGINREVDKTGEPDIRELKEEKATLQRKNLELRKELEHLKEALNKSQTNISEITDLQRKNRELGEEVTNLKKVTNKSRVEILSPTDCLFDKAAEKLKKDEFIEAAGFLQAILMHDPEHTKALNNLAIVYCELGFVKKAKETFRLILKKDPENIIVEKNLEILSGKRAWRFCFWKSKGKKGSVEINGGTM